MLEELSREQIEHLLHSEIVGHIGCHADGRTYVVPTTYAYDGECIYGHTAEGMKLRMMRANPEVCFQVDHRADLSNWQSVIAWGTFEELHGPAATQAMELLLDRLLPLTTNAGEQISHGQVRQSVAEGATQEHLCLYRIRLRERTGRCERH